MTIFLLIAVIILAIIVFCILIYLWWLPVKIKRIANEAIDEDNAIQIVASSDEEEEEEDD